MWISALVFDFMMCFIRGCEWIICGFHTKKTFVSIFNKLWLSWLSVIQYPPQNMINSLAHSLLLLIVAVRRQAYELWVLRQEIIAPHEKWFPGKCCGVTIFGNSYQCTRVWHKSEHNEKWMGPDDWKCTHYYSVVANPMNGIDWVLSGRWRWKHKHLHTHYCRL